MTKIETYRAKILAFVQGEILFGRNDRDITAATSLFAGKVLDSMNLVEVIGFLESAFSIQVRPSEVIFENLDSIEAMANFVERKAASL